MVSDTENETILSAEVVCANCDKFVNSIDSDGNCEECHNRLYNNQEAKEPSKYTSSMMGKVALAASAIMLVTSIILFNSKVNDLLVMILFAIGICIGVTFTLFFMEKVGGAGDHNHCEVCNKTNEN